MACAGGCRVINDHPAAAARIARGREWFARRDADPKKVLHERDITHEQEHWLYHKLRAIRRPFLCRVSLPDPRTTPFDKLLDAIAAEFGQASIRAAVTRAVTEDKSLVLVNKWLKSGVMTSGVARLVLARFRTEHRILAAPAPPPLPTVSAAHPAAPVIRDGDIEGVTLLGGHATYLEKALHTTVVGFVARVMAAKGVSFRFINRAEHVSGCVIGEKQVRLEFPGLVEAMIRSAADETIRMARSALLMTDRHTEYPIWHTEDPDWETVTATMAEFNAAKFPVRPKKMTKKQLRDQAKQQAKDDLSRMQREFLTHSFQGGARKRKAVAPPDAAAPAAAKARRVPPRAERGRLDPEAIWGLVVENLPRGKLILNVLSMTSPKDVLKGNPLGWHGFLSSSEVLDGVLAVVKTVDPEIHDVVTVAAGEAVELLTIVTIEHLDRFVGEMHRLLRIKKGDVVRNCSPETWREAVAAARRPRGNMYGT